jgi:hypothetical protein
MNAGHNYPLFAVEWFIVACGFCEFDTIAAFDGGYGLDAARTGAIIVKMT